MGGLGKHICAADSRVLWYDRIKDRDHELYRLDIWGKRLCSTTVDQLSGTASYLIKTSRLGEQDR